MRHGTTSSSPRSAGARDPGPRHLAGEKPRWTIAAVLFVVVTVTSAQLLAAFGPTRAIGRGALHVQYYRFPVLIGPLLLGLSTAKFVSHYQRLQRNMRYAGGILTIFGCALILTRLLLS